MRVQKALGEWSFTYHILCDWFFFSMPTNYFATASLCIRVCENQNINIIIVVVVVNNKVRRAKIACMQNPRKCQRPTRKVLRCNNIIILNKRRRCSGVRTYYYVRIILSLTTDKSKARAFLRARLEYYI